MALPMARGQEHKSTDRRRELIEATCKIKMRGGGSGSGSLCKIEGILCVLTNNHVLGSADQASGAKAVFTALSGDTRTCTVSFEPSVLFATDEKLDYTFVAVRDVPELHSPVVPVELSESPLSKGDVS